MLKKVSNLIFNVISTKTMLLFDLRGVRPWSRLPLPQKCNCRRLIPMVSPSYLVRASLKSNPQSLPFRQLLLCPISLSFIRSNKPANDSSVYAFFVRASYWHCLHLHLHHPVKLYLNQGTLSLSILLLVPTP